MAYATNYRDRFQDLIAKTPASNHVAVSAMTRDLAQIVILTQAAYDALAVKDANVIYITTAT